MTGLSADPALRATEVTPAAAVRSFGATSAVVQTRRVSTSMRESTRMSGLRARRGSWWYRRFAWPGPRVRGVVTDHGMPRPVMKARAAAAITMTAAMMKMIMSRRADLFSV